MKTGEREHTDTDYRPWSWIAGFNIAAFIFWLMFELSLRVGG